MKRSWKFNGIELGRPEPVNFTPRDKLGTWPEPAFESLFLEDRNKFNLK